MIVPRSRLLLWVAIVMVPFALLGGVEPAATALAASVIGALTLLSLVDALRARRGFEGISVALPAVARMSKDRGAKLELRIRNEGQQSKKLRLGLALPTPLASEQADALVELPAGSEWSKVDWRCLPRKRGNYQLNAVYLETDSPLGFWGTRRTMPANCEIRVYPNLFRERRELAGLFLHRGLFGLHAQRQLGKGRDFEKLREYVPGDDFHEIHWKATARRGRPITKVFQIEKTQEVYVIVDTSRLSARPVTNIQSPPNPQAASAAPSAPTPSSEASKALAAATSTLERFVTAALVLGLAAEQQGDLFGLVTFGDKVEKFIRAKNGKAHYSICRDALYALEARIVTPDYDELCTFLRLRLRRRALVLILTSLDDPVLAQSFVKNVEIIRRQHVVLVNMLQPAGVGPLFNNPHVQSVDELYQHLGGHLLWHNLRELQGLLQRRGVRFSLLKNERLSAELVSQYLNVKQRQLI